MAKTFYPNRLDWSNLCNLARLQAINSEDTTVFTHYSGNPNQVKSLFSD